MNFTRRQYGNARSWRGYGLLLAAMMLVLALLAGCGPSTEALAAVDYAPVPGGDWPASTPAEQGLDPDTVAALYLDAAELETLYGLLVVKDGYLIAEEYFNEGTVHEAFDRASATKSFTSALVGLAIAEGCLDGVDVPMIDFFPEYAGQIEDPRKAQITVRDLLQMRGGYPDEEYTPPYMDILYAGGNWHHVPHLVDFPLTGAPGGEFQYSNLTSHLLAVIVARACGEDLLSFGQTYLFAPLGADVDDWYPDADDYRLGGMGIFISARDMAKFGSLYLNDGQYNGQQVLPAALVRDSLQRYSDGIRRGGSSSYGAFRDLGYGYQWWSGSVGDHTFSYAAGHGGNFIILLDELDMVIVTTADPMHNIFGEESWRHEGAINRMVGAFIDALPEG